MKNYTLLSCLDSRIIHPTKFYGRFELGKYAHGQALTVANTLRRSLLSQIPGAAITLVEMENIIHEYETLPGIRECALDIILNLKTIVLKSEFELFSPHVGFLNVKGPCIVRARDLKLPFFISCVDPDQYIATVEKNQLNLVFLINCGKNYLNHTPSSPGYETRVQILKQNKQMVALSPDYKKLYSKWKKQRFEMPSQNTTCLTYLVESKLNEKRVVRFQNDDRITTSNRKKMQTLTKNKKLLNRFLRRQKKQKKLRLHSVVTNNDSNQPLTNQKLEKEQNQQKQTQEVLYNMLNHPTTKTRKENLKTYNLLTTEPVKKTKLGYFPINAIFSPVTKVNYTIRNKRKGQTGEWIQLEVWTNGGIDPRYAIHRGVKALIQLFLPLQMTQTNLFPLPSHSLVKTNDAKVHFVPLLLPKRQKDQGAKTPTLKRLANAHIKASLTTTAADLNIEAKSQINVKKTVQFNQVLKQLQKKQLIPSVLKQKGKKQLNNQTQDEIIEFRLNPQHFPKLLQSKVGQISKDWPILRLITPLLLRYQIPRDTYYKLLTFDILTLRFPFQLYIFLKQLKVKKIKHVLALSSADLTFFSPNIAFFLNAIVKGFHQYFLEAGFKHLSVNDLFLRASNRNQYYVYLQRLNMPTYLNPNTNKKTKRRTSKKKKSRKSSRLAMLARLRKARQKLKSSHDERSGGRGRGRSGGRGRGRISGRVESQGK